MMDLVNVRVFVELLLLSLIFLLVMCCCRVRKFVLAKVVVN